MTDSKYQDLFQNIRNYFHNSNHSIHKARNEIKILNYDEDELVVKSFKIPNLINKIAYTFFRNSKAKKSYLNSSKIIDFVPKPIGFVEFKKLGLLYDSYYISENFKYDFTIRELLFDDDFKDKKIILKEFANFSSSLHKNGIYHLDYSPGNILIKYEDGNYIFKIVDVNRMKFIDFDIKTRAKNFSRIWFNDNDLKYVLQEYAELNGISDDNFIDLGLEYSQKHKVKTELKKRLKQ